MKVGIGSGFVVSLVRVLAWRNGLEGFVSMLGLVLGVAIILLTLDGVSVRYDGLPQWPFSQPLLGCSLAATGMFGLLSLATRQDVMRMGSSIAAFIVWGLLAVWGYQSPHGHSTSDAVIYTALAAAELATYVRILTGLDPSKETRIEAMQRIDRSGHNVRGD